MHGSGRRGYSTQWDNFYSQLEPIASRVPYMVSVGNHERNWPGSGDRWGGFGIADSGGECGVAHALRARMPYQGECAPVPTLPCGGRTASDFPP